MSDVDIRQDELLRANIRAELLAVRVSEQRENIDSLIDRAEAAERHNAELEATIVNNVDTIRRLEVRGNEIQSTAKRLCALAEARAKAAEALADAALLTIARLASNLEAVHEGLEIQGKALEAAETKLARLQEYLATRRAAYKAGGIYDAGWDAGLSIVSAMLSEDPFAYAARGECSRCGSHEHTDIRYHDS